ncbi:MAG: hypothetical protein GX369_01590 [Euryarchaeota archaeon]|nr:hypothetical protein [Euryarchaeota archaeon]
MKFREKKYAMPIGLVLAIILGIILTPFLGVICFAPLLVALIGFYIPYYFGLKDRRKLAVWGLAFVLILSIPFTLSVISQIDASENNMLHTPDNELYNGTVTPFRGSPGDTHEFSIMGTSEVVNNSVKVIITNALNGQKVNEFTMIASGEMSGDQEFTYRAEFDDNALYSYQFTATVDGKPIETGRNLGPVYNSNTDIFIAYWPTVIFALLIQVGLLFYFLLAFNWYSERSRARMEDMIKQRQLSQDAFPDKIDAGEELTCSKCGANVSEDTSRCSQCGERFGDELSHLDENEFECSECGATVVGDAKRCWKCGVEFEE